MSQQEKVQELRNKLLQINTVVEEARALGVTINFKVTSVKKTVDFKVTPDDIAPFCIEIQSATINQGL